MSDHFKACNSPQRKPVCTRNTIRFACVINGRPFFRFITATCSNARTSSFSSAMISRSGLNSVFFGIFICPVNLTKPGLGYREDENRIGPRIRDWVVGAPDTGFVFPAFTDRSTDIHSVMFYTRDTKTPHAEFMESGLGCGAKFTATEKKLTFQNIVKDVIGEDDEESDAMFLDIQGNLSGLIEVPAEDEEENWDDDAVGVI